MGEGARPLRPALIPLEMGWWQARRNAIHKMFWSHFLSFHVVGLVVPTSWLKRNSFLGKNVMDHRNDFQVEHVLHSVWSLSVAVLCIKALALCYLARAIFKFYQKTRTKCVMKSICALQILSVFFNSLPDEGAEFQKFVNNKKKTSQSD